MASLPRQPGYLYREFRNLFASNVKDIYGPTDATQAGGDFEILWMHYQQGGSSSSAKSTMVDNVHAGAIAAGHECKVTVYVNGTFGESSSFPTGGVHRPEEFMYSGDSALPYCIDSFDTYLMDVRDRGWWYACRGSAGGSNVTSVPEQAVNRSQTVFGTTKADGVGVDSIGWGVVTANYSSRTSGDGNPPTTIGSGVTPSNSQTGNTWIGAAEKSIWVRATVAPLSACTGMRQGGETITVFCNGVSNGDRWFDNDGPVWQFTKYAQLCMAENWIRTNSEALDFSALQTLAQWKADVNYVIDCQNLGRGAMLWTKVWANHTHTDDVLFVSPIAGNTITMPSGHGFNNGDTVSVGGSGTVPTGLSLSGLYFVVNRSTTSIQLANSSGGAAITISGGQNVRVRQVVSQNATDDNDDTNITKWHRLFAGSFMLATNGQSLAEFVHDWPNGNQRIPVDRWKDNINAMGWYTESFTAGLGVWVTVDSTAITNDEFVSTAHGFGNNQQVIVDYEAPSGVTGISPRTIYFKRPGATNADANHFSLSTTSGGAAINLTTTAGVAYPYQARVRSADGSNGGTSCGVGAAQDPTSTNLYVRHFENGIVIVNPTGAGSLNTYTLPGGTWYDVDDTPLSGTITVDNTKYAVLLRDAL